MVKSHEQQPAVDPDETTDQKWNKVFSQFAGDDSQLDKVDICSMAGLELRVWRRPNSGESCGCSDPEEIPSRVNRARS